MTISTTINRKAYTGDGATVAFAFPYYFILEVDLTVYVEEVLQTLTTDYTISGEGNPSGGTVTFEVGSTPASGAKIVIVRDPAITQTTDWVENDPDSAANKETAFDKLTMIAQRLKDTLDRSISLSDYDVSTVDATLPSPSDGKVLGWSVSGDSAVIVNLDTGDVFIPIQATEPDGDTYKVWYDSANQVLKYWDGAAWQEPASIDISSKQNVDADAVDGNIAVFDTTHTVDSGTLLSDLLAVTPLQRGRAKDITQDTTSLESYDTVSDTFTVTPISGVSELQGWLHVNAYVSDDTNNSVVGQFIAGYINNVGTAVEVGTTRNMQSHAQDSGSGSNRYTGQNITIPFVLSSTQVNASGDWAVVLRAKVPVSSNDVIVIDQVEIEYEEYLE